MGSKGSNQVTTSQQQQYTPNPLISGAGTQAINMAQSAASQPFQMPVAPVAGFTPFQQQAFGQVQGMQGMAQPYFNAGTNYLQQSATPITGQDVAQYYNPMAANVTAQMQNIFGQQAQNTLGQLTQQAGGVGADRIAVGQAQLANQQGLAAGQTYANLYQQALQAAQAQKQMAAGAGYGLAQMGPAAQNAYLQGTQALGAAGAQQQQLSQAQLNAAYQQQLAGIAYPFQTAQYLAGITGGLAPAFGGTTTGTATTTYPSPSPLAQALGIGTAGLGMFGDLGGFGALGSMGSGLKGAGAAGAAGGGADMSAMLPLAFANRGGRAMAPGGMVSAPYGDIAARAAMGDPAGNPYAIPPANTYSPEQDAHDAQGYDDGGGVGGAVDDMNQQAQPMGVSGLPFPGAGQVPRGIIPTIQLPAGSGEAHTQGHIQHQYPYMPGGMQTGQTQDVNAALRMAQMLNQNYSSGMNRGGIAHYDDGGPLPITNEDIGNPYDIGSPPPSYTRGSVYGPIIRNEDPGGYSFPAFPGSANAPTVGDIPVATLGRTQGSQQDLQGTNFNPPVPSIVPAKPQLPAPMQGSSPFQFPPTGPGAIGFPPMPPTGAPQAPPRLPIAPPSGGDVPIGGGRMVNADMTPDTYMMPQDKQPYPDALKRDWGQNLTRSPWMALVKAGAAMATSTGPIGSVIGKGLAAGAGELEGQRKSLETEEQINQKAQSLYQQAKIHLDKYQRKTPHEIATEAHQAAALAQGKFQAVNYTDENGNIKVSVFDTRHGAVLDPTTHQPVSAGRLLGRANKPGISEADIARTMNDPEFAGMPYDQRRAIAISKLQQGQASPTAPQVSSAANPLPDPGEGKRVKGQWYIGPTGKPQQWNG